MVIAVLTRLGRLIRIGSRVMRAKRQVDERITSSTRRFPRMSGSRGGLVRHEREGTTLVEIALVLPVFLVFMGGIVEFGHAFMVSSTFHNATKVAARNAVSGTMTSAEVKQSVIDRLDGIVNTSNITVMVKDASVLATDVGQGGLDVDTLPDINLDTASPTQLFLVRVEISYSDVALIAPNWGDGVDISGQTVMRRE